MEIWLLVAIVTVGASALYVAATFDKRTTRHTTPLADKAEAISGQIEGTGKGLRTVFRAALTVRRGSRPGR